MRNLLSAFLVIVRMDDLIWPTWAVTGKPHKDHTSKSYRESPSSWCEERVLIIKSIYFKVQSIYMYNQQHNKLLWWSSHSDMKRHMLLLILLCLLTLWDKVSQTRANIFDSSLISVSEHQRLHGNRLTALTSDMRPTEADDAFVYLNMHFNEWIIWHVSRFLPPTKQPRCKNIFTPNISKRENPQHLNKLETHNLLHSFFSMSP